MADKKKVTYKFKRDELDMDKYLHNLSTNVLSYIESQDWTPEQKQEFTNSYGKYMAAMLDQLDNNTERFSTDDTGRIVDSKGEFNDTDDDNIDPNGSEYYYNEKTGLRITTDDYNLLKDSPTKKNWLRIFLNPKKHKDQYKTFNANLLVALYFSTIANADNVRDKILIKKEDLKDFSSDEYGRAWGNRFNPSGSGEWQSLIDDDDFNEKTGKRSRVNRLKKLSDFTEGWLNDFDESKYNFNNGPFKDGSDARQRFTAFHEALKSGDWAQIQDTAREAGIDSKWLNNYLTENKEVIQSDESSEAKELTPEDIRKKFRLEGIAARYSGDRLEKYIEMKTRGLNVTQDAQLKEMQDQLDDDDYDLWASELTPFADLQYGKSYTGHNWNDRLKGVGKNFYVGYKPLTDESARLNYLNTQLSRDLLSDNNKYWDNVAKLSYWVQGPGSKQFRIGSSNQYYLPWTIDPNDNSVFTYDINDRTIRKRFAPNLENELLKKGLKEQWKTSRATKHQTGGVIWGTGLGEMVDVGAAAEAAQAKKLAAEEKKRLEKVRKFHTYAGIPGDKRSEKEMKAGSQTRDIFNEKDGWGLTDRDLWRLGNAAADLGATAAAFIPGYGTAASGALGVGSSLSNAVADFTDDSVSTGEAIRNLGINLGSDLVGLIPGIGTTAKVGKIVKTLKPVSKVLKAGLLALNTETAIESANALGRILDNPHKATTDDITQVMRGLQLVIGKGGKGLANKRNLSKATTKGNLSYELKGSDGKKYTLTKALMDEINAATDDAAKNVKLTQMLGVDPETKFATRGRNGSWNPLKWNMLNHNPSIRENSLRYLNSQNRNPKRWTNEWIYNKLGFGYVPVEGLVNTPNVFQETSDVSLNPRMLVPNSPLKKNIGKKAPAHFGIPDPNIATPGGRFSGMYRTPYKQASRRPAVLPLVVGTFKKGGNIEKLRKMSKGGEIPFMSSGSPITYRSSNILKFQNPAGPINGKRRLSDVNGVDQYSFKSDYDPSRGLFAGDTSKGYVKAYESPTPGNDEGRYAALNDNSDASRLMVQAILAQKPYNDFQTWLDTDPKHLELFNKDTDAKKPKGSRTTIYDENGKMRTSWSAGNNNIYGEEGLLFTNAADYTKHSRYDDVLGTMHNIYGKFGKRYFVKLKDGTKKYISEDDAKLFTISKNPVDSIWDSERGTQWDDYEVTEPTYTTPALDDTKPKPNPNVNPKQTPKLDPTLLHSIPRAIWSDNVNRQIRDMAKANERVLLKDPFQIQRRQFGNLRAMMDGLNAKGDLLNQANIPQTSDASLDRQSKLEATIQGNKFVNEGNAKDDEMQRTTGEQAWLQEKENALNRHETAMFNRQSLLLTLYNKGALDIAYKAKLHEIYDTLWQQIEYESRMKLQENKAYLESANQLMLLDDILGNPENYGLSKDEAEIYQAYLNGAIKPTELYQKDPTKYKLLSLAQTKFKKAQMIGTLRLHGINYTAPTYSSKKGFVSIATDKNGGKLSDDAKITQSKIRERIKNGDRFQRGILAYLKRNQKDIERLSKSMYGYPKLK